MGQRPVEATFRWPSIAAAMLAFVVIGVPYAYAQAPETVAAMNEDIEPRRIGAAGTTTVGVSGYVDRFSSSRDNFSTNYTAQVDVARFLTDRIAVRGGLAGSGTIGGDDAEDRPVGTGTAALHMSAGALYYFRPQSMLSLYAGADYWAQLTGRLKAASTTSQRTSTDAGTVLGTLGVEGAVSSRARLYIEGGYGVALTRGEDDETVSRVTGRVGIRLKF